MSLSGGLRFRFVWNNVAGRRVGVGVYVFHRKRKHEKDLSMTQISRESKTKASKQSPAGVRGRRIIVVAGERRIRGPRWAGSGYA